jgi:hypothetical protein
MFFYTLLQLIKFSFLWIAAAIATTATGSGTTGTGTTRTGTTGT